MTRAPLVVSHHSGSHCVISRGGNMERYIDARTHGDTMTHIELVRGGRVRAQEFARNSEAPERLIELMKEFLQ